MANAQSIELHASAQESSDSSGTGVDIGATRSACKLTLTATEVTDGALTVLVETSPDNATGWRQIAAFTPVGGIPFRSKISVLDCDRYVRVSWTLGTTATFAVEGTAHQLFATRDDLDDEIPGSIMDSNRVTQDVVAHALIKASCDTETSLAKTNPTPITKWNASITSWCCQIAAYHIVKRRGFSPDGTDEVWRDDMLHAMKCLEKVRFDEIRPVGVEPESNLVPKTSSGNAASPQVYRPKFTSNWGDF